MIGYLRKPRWSPYVVGIGIGMLSWATFYFMEKALGTSTSFVGVAGSGLCTVAPEHVAGNAYYLKEYGAKSGGFKPVFDWQMSLDFALVVGAFLAAWLGAVLWITGVLPYVLGELDEIRWKIGNTQITARNVLDGVVSSVVVLVLALWLSSAFEARLLRGATDNLSIRRMAATLVRTLLLFLGLMFSLSAAGIDLTTLGVLGGAVGVGVGFGLQRLASNYVSGFVILAERSMRIGDIVKVDSFEGRITDITTRYTMIRALNGRESIVPNEMMVTQRVENYSLADPNVAVTTTVQVAYGTDLDAVLPRLVAAAAAVPRVIAAPAPSAQLSEFAADGLNLTVGFWIADPVNGTGNVRSDVNLAILRTLDAMGVEIPFPQRVLRRSGAG